MTEILTSCFILYTFLVSFPDWSCLCFFYPPFLIKMSFTCVSFKSTFSFLSFPVCCVFPALEWSWTLYFFHFGFICSGLIRFACLWTVSLPFDLIHFLTAWNLLYLMCQHLGPTIPFPSVSGTSCGIYSSAPHTCAGTSKATRFLKNV